MAQSGTDLLSSITFLQTLESSDEQLLKNLYSNNYRGVEQYITRNSGSTEDAKDLYQEAFLAVWRNVQLGSFKPANENEYGAYLFRVAKNKWIDQLRAGKNRQIIPLGDESLLAATDGMEQTETNQYIDEVIKKFSALGERCRSLLELFYFKKQSMQQIAAFFSWTEESAKNNKYRCLKQLRESVINKLK
ncbi:MAG: RNA polymerase sigma factor [Pseudobacter sp.]|uniref:RNA polymerase sigma factor n=1 Tax=Pseudobacter sp. TaxID=2045420 RepID=UPI003F80E0ED